MTTVKNEDGSEMFSYDTMNDFHNALDEARDEVVSAQSDFIAACSRMQAAKDMLSKFYDALTDEELNPMHNIEGVYPEDCSHDFHRERWLATGVEVHVEGICRLKTYVDMLPDTVDIQHPLTLRFENLGNGVLHINKWSQTK